MKDIKLRRSNSMKYCGGCNKNVEVIMKGLNGSCPDCGVRLYTLDNRQKIDKKRGNEYGK